MEYVWGLHPFTPEHDDEIEFKTGERILVIEKDEVYQDGWWKGTNVAGKTGLFPQSYTTSVPPAPVNMSTPSKLMGQAATLSALAEDEEPSSPDDKDGDARIIHQPQPVHATQPGTATVLHATMTDIQEAIEQLGARPDSAGAGSRSFSFASTKGGAVTDDDGDGVDDAEFATGWNTDARSRLAANAAKQQTIINAAVSHQPPIEVEMSDESEEEGEHMPSLSSLGTPSPAYDAARSIPDLIQATADAQAAVHAAEAEEEAPITARPLTNGHGHARHESEATIAYQPSSNNTLTQANPRKHTISESTTNTITSVSAAHDASTREPPAPVVPVLSSEKDGPLPAARMGEPTPPASVAAAQAVSLPSSSVASHSVASSAEIIVSTISPVALVPSTAEPASATAASLSSVPTSPDSGSGRSTNPPSEWTVEEVVAWLRSKKFDEAVCAKFIGKWMLYLCRN